jgi:uncharacterized membrane protein YoaK (UPF0700 family)
LLTFTTGLVDAVSVLVLGRVFMANMTGNVIFLGSGFVPQSGVDMMAAVVAFASFIADAVLGGRLARHLDAAVRRWLVVFSGAVLGAARDESADGDRGPDAARGERAAVAVGTLPVVPSRHRGNLQLIRS